MPGGDDPVLGGLDGGQVLRGDAGVLALIRRDQVGDVLREILPAGTHQLGERHPVRLREGPRGHVADQQRQLAGQHLLGPADPDQGQRLGHQLRVVLRRIAWLMTWVPSLMILL
jgi:hypothetical protein